jgi:hypothetical protein
MMSLLFRQVTNPIHKHLRFAKVREAITLLQVMLVDDFPSLQLRKQFRYLFPS